MSRENYNKLQQALNLWGSDDGSTSESGYDMLTELVEEVGLGPVFTDDEISEIKTLPREDIYRIQMLMEVRLEESTVYNQETGKPELSLNLNEDFIRCLGDQQFKDLINYSIADNEQMEEHVKEILDREDIHSSEFAERFPILLSRCITEESRNPAINLLTVLKAVTHPEKMAGLLIKKLITIETDMYVSFAEECPLNSRWYNNVPHYIRTLLVYNILNNLDADSIGLILKDRQYYTNSTGFNKPVKSLIDFILIHATAEQLSDYINATDNQEKADVIARYNNLTKVVDDSYYNLTEELQNLNDSKDNDLYNSIQDNLCRPITEEECKKVRQLPKDITQPLVDMVISLIKNIDYDDNNFCCYVDINQVAIDKSIFKALKEDEIEDLINKAILDADQLGSDEAWNEFILTEYSMSRIENAFTKRTVNWSQGPSLYLVYALTNTNNPRKSLELLFKRVEKVEDKSYMDYVLKPDMPWLINSSTNYALKLIADAYFDTLSTSKLAFLFRKFHKDNVENTEPRAVLEYLFVNIPNEIKLDYIATTTNVEHAHVLTRFMYENGITEKAISNSNSIAFGRSTKTDQYNNRLDMAIKGDFDLARATKEMTKYVGNDAMTKAIKEVIHIAMDYPNNEKDLEYYKVYYDANPEERRLLADAVRYATYIEENEYEEFLQEYSKESIAYPLPTECFIKVLGDDYMDFRLSYLSQKFHNLFENTNYDWLDDKKKEYIFNAVFNEFLRISLLIPQAKNKDDVADRTMFLATGIGEIIYQKVRLDSYKREYCLMMNELTKNIAEALNY